MLWVSACSGGSSGGTDTGASALPEETPKFSVSPMSFPGGVNADLNSLGIYNTKCDCDVTHYGWDLSPNWSSYPDNKVPVLAAADGVVSNIVQRATNVYQGHEVNTYVVVLSVSKDIDVHYTFEPFAALGENDSLAYLNVKNGDSVKAGDVIGYLPRLAGNLGESLIHLDLKIGSSAGTGEFFCPTGYFSSAWQQENSSVLPTKTGKCTQLCCE
jgi:murein DD-endopeptidase MepM/ murein hydrolase activator NlpD